MNDIDRLKKRVASLEAELALYKMEDELCKQKNLQMLADYFYDVLFAVCQAFGVSRYQLMGEYRGKDIDDARQVAMIMVRKKGLSCQDVGKMFNRHYSTILHAERSVRNKKIEPLFNQRLQQIQTALKNQLIPK